MLRAGCVAPWLCAVQMAQTQKNHDAHRSIGYHALPSLAWNHLPATLHEISGLREKWLRRRG
uniref:Uncharacterized protein n=1 Tax=Magnetococcus massalia (strain MO-1) TaxID=451514 RepID=A0A1S7LKG2_MAGMO|nr:exported protein of unknown function [Candidatus Magnetococcus massalia]